MMRIERVVEIKHPFADMGERFGRGSMVRHGTLIA